MPSLNFNSALQRLLPCVLVTLTSGAIAQAASSTAQPERPGVLPYVSPLQSYKAYADQPVEPWREANDRVGRIGGWRAYAREIQTGAPAQDAAQRADPHAGHRAAPRP